MSDITEKFIKEGKEMLAVAGLMALCEFSEDVVKKEKKTERGTGMVTAVDEEINQYLIAETKKTFPGFGIISEEGGQVEPEEGCNYTVCIDPLDGTSYYVNKSEEFVITYSLLDNTKGEPIACVVYKPLTLSGEKESEIFTAVKGQKAYVHRKYPNQIKQLLELKVTETSSVENARVLKSKHGSSKELEDVLAKMNFKSIVEVGSAANKLCKIAQGAADAYIHFAKDNSNRLSIWDTCPKLIVEEAGGEVTNLKSNIYDSVLVVSNKNLHAEILKRLKDLLN